jgi:hypothetical protein
MFLLYDVFVKSQMDYSVGPLPNKEKIIHITVPHPERLRTNKTNGQYRQGGSSGSSVFLYIIYLGHSLLLPVHNQFPQEMLELKKVKWIY